MEHVSHKTVDSIYNAWKAALSDYLKVKQSTISFGNPNDDLCSTDPACMPDEKEFDDTAVRRKELGTNQV